MPDMSVFLPGPPPLASEHSGSPQQKEPTTMRMGDTYQPVPGEDKNPDVDFVNASSRSKQSMVSSIYIKLDFYTVVRTLNLYTVCQIKLLHHWIGGTGIPIFML